MRTKLSVMLFAVLALSALLLAGGARAQREGNDNASGGAKSKRVVGVRSSDTGNGSRVTITADDSLKDYSAYRSGDRFYVVLPKAAAGARGGGSGKGYTDMQVQQRGDSVVLSYRVQPGAKPRVEQKFNRLDVVFDVADEAAQAAANNASRQQPQTPPAENRNPAAQQNNQTATSTPNANPTPERRQPTAGEVARTQATDAAAVNATAPGTVAGQPTTVVDPAAQSPAATLTEPSPAPTAPPATEIAQAQPPTAIAPITTNQPAPVAQTGTSLGTYLVQNWALIFAVLVVVGFGLIFVARRTTSPAPVEGLDDESAAKQEEPRTARAREATARALKDASAAAQASTVTTPEPAGQAETVGAAEASDASKTDVTPLIAATALAGGAAVAKSRKQSKREAKQEARRKKDRRAEESVAESTVAAPVAQETVVEEPAVEESAVAAPVAEEPAAVEPVAEETNVQPELVVETPFVEGLDSEEPAEVAQAVTTEEVASDVAEPIVESAEPEEIEVVAPSLETAAPSLDTTEVETKEVVPVPAETALSLFAEAPASVEELEPTFAPDSERVLDETRNLLEGEAYDRTVIGSRDAMARQMVAAELLSALAGRNAQRRGRAGTAFVEHGYFDETARDLREADAPAERSAAARSLAILGDRKATPLLVAALEDPVSDVRRAAVEALGALRDPSAVEPLEALLEREKKERNRIPPRVIRTVVEICREGFAETQTVETQTVEPAVEVSKPAAFFETATAPEEAEEFLAAVTISVKEVAGVEPLVAPGPAAEATGEPAHVPEPVQTEESVSADEELTVAVESHELETAGVEPFVELAEEPAAVEEVNVEPAAWLEEEVSTLETFEFDMGQQESGPAALFDAGADEATREGEYVADDTLKELTPSASEWFDLDLGEIGSAESPAASSAAVPEQASTEPSASESIFESSSGETLAAPAVAEVEEDAPVAEVHPETAREIEVAHDTAEASPVLHEPAAEVREKGLAPFDELSTVPTSIQQRLASSSPAERAAAIVELSHADTDEAFQQICAAFDDESKDVRAAAARALHELRTDRAESFTRALREATPERRREIGAAISSSGLAAESISQLTGESRERTYEAFSLLFLMAKAGEVQPLLRAIESHPNNEVRLAVVKLLALSGQKDVLPAFRRLAVRGSLPTEVRSAIMEAIYQISSSQPTHA